jgi:hypothetical protein
LRDPAIGENEARMAALERQVGQLTMELDLAKKTPRPLIAGDNERSFSSPAHDLLHQTGL